MALSALRAAQVDLVFNHTVSQVYHPVAALCGCHGVRYHDDRLPAVVKLGEYVQYILRVLRVERSRGLIRKKYLRSVDDTSYNCYTLLLSAR